VRDPRELTETYPGVYRAAIEVTSDPEQRKRYRVRVSNVHPPEVESDHLPWAEHAVAFGGGSFGDIPAFEVGDPVWVMFEGGDRRFPVIVGGILNFEGGLPPLPAEQTAEYDRTSKRWTRIDRVGNKIEMSPLDDELWITVETPDGSRIRVGARDGTIELRGEGRIQLTAPAVQIVDADQVTANTRILIADVTEETTLRCGGVTNIRAADEINIGEYQPPGSPPPLPERSQVINIKAADTIVVESAGLLDVDVAGEIQVDGQSKITIKSASDLKIESDAALTILAQGDTLIDLEGDCQLQVQGNVVLDLEGTLTVDAALKIEVNCNAAIEVNAASTFTLTADGDFDIEGSVNMTIDAGANMDVTCGAILTLQATSRIELSAPTIRIDAGSLVELLGGSTTRIDGGVILIG